MYNKENIIKTINRTLDKEFTKNALNYLNNELLPDNSSLYNEFMDYLDIYIREPIIFYYLYNVEDNENRISIEIRSKNDGEYLINLLNEDTDLLETTLYFKRTYITNLTVRNLLAFQFIIININDLYINKKKKKILDSMDIEIERTKKELEYINSEFNRKSQIYEKNIEKLKKQREEIQGDIVDELDKIQIDNNTLKKYIVKYIDYDIKKYKCSICFENDKNILLTKCKHFEMCETCAYNVDNKCPICRDDFEMNGVDIIKIY